MQHFQSILIFIGIVAIGGVLIHGYLLSRKEKQTTINNPLENVKSVDIFAEKFAPVIASLSNEVASEVVVKEDLINDNIVSEKDNIDFSSAEHNDKINNVDFNEKEQEPIAIIDTPLAAVKEAPAQVITENKPVMKESTLPSDLFVFNVTAKEGAVLGGHELLQFFLTSGFRFGDMSIFHRHEDSDGKGPVLFSIANMMAPGVFDPDSMEQFKSEGVSFFLTAPNNKINIKEAFNLMLCAVEQMAEEFDCEVLNAERQIMTTEEFMQFNHRLAQYS